jgi:hypothetical protein
VKRYLHDIQVSFSHAKKPIATSFLRAVEQYLRFANVNNLNIYADESIGARNCSFATPKPLKTIVMQ